MARLKPGDTIGRYCIEALIGSGGMGEVYRAFDPPLQRRVALKVLRSPGDEGESGETRGRMLREARAAAALDHPNVVAIFDVGEIEGDAFVAMELVPGRTLRAYVGDASVPLTDRLRWLADVARALGAAHARGLVHRDVKPDNVMVRDDGVIKVLDFGIAKRIEAKVDAEGHATITRPGAVIGTPRYMAPEQLRREVLDGRADQFAWGVMAYEILAGKPPWSSSDAFAMISEILTREPEPFPAPAHVMATLLRALSKQREERFPTMEALVASLENRKETVRPVPSAPVVKAAATTKMTSTALPSPSPPPAARRRWWIPTLLLLIGAVVGSLLMVRAARKREPTVRGPECGTSADCASRGAGHRCRRGACVSLASVDCKVLAEESDASREDTIWLGAMLPLTGPDGEEFGRKEMQAVELARRDFALTLRGFREKGAPIVARPIAVVGCDDAVDPSRAARHLVDGVGVAAVIGFHSSTEAVDLAASTFLPNDVLTMASLNTSALVTAVPQGNPRRIWRTTYNMSHTALPVSRFIADSVEPRVKPRGSMRVALVRVRTAGAHAFSDSFFRVLRFNDQSALENGPRFKEIVYDDPGAPGAAPDWRAVVAELEAFRPDAVTYIGPGAFITNVVEPLERAWPPGAPRPTYVTMNVLAPEVFAFVGASAERRHRFFGLTTASSTTVNARFVMHYNETFKDQVSRTVAPNTSYDAFYVLAYAALALGDEPVNGTALARAIARLLPPGKPIEVGPTGIFDAVATLRAGQNIDLQGATGPLDFDVTTGEAPLDHVILCVNVDAGGKAFDTIESGLVYRSSAKKLEGALRCP